MSVAADITPVAPDLPTGDVVLSARNVAKSYGNVHALKGVNFDIHRGQVTTLFGENGAGKSTLMKVLSGVVQPTSGEIVLDGEPVTFGSAAEATARGISIIHQELSLAPNLSVRDNIFMGREIRGLTGVDFAEEARQTRALMKELEEDIDPLTLVEDLRLGQQQIVEIARALSVNSRILIMDEPTSALSASEVEVLFKVIRDLKGRGVSIVYISHHLDEALQITDHAVVLRDGAVTARGARRDVDLQWIVRHMVGEHFDLGSPPVDHPMGEVALSIENLSVPAPGGGYDVVDRLSLSVRAGEIVCIYGLMGAGRTELMECVAGRLQPSGGRIMLGGRDVAGLTIAQRIARGLVLTPEDRQRDGLVQTMTVGQNLSLASIGAFTRGIFTSRRRERKIVDDAIRDVTIKTDGGHAAIGSLSGGNQQKVVIGKMLATKPGIMLLDEPSRGIDVGAKAEVFKLLAEGARNGLAVVFSTSEVSECLSIAHRIVVMHKGRIAAEFGPDASKEQIMAASGEVDLRQLLLDTYRLRHCEVVADPHQQDLPLGPLGLAGARFLAGEIGRKPDMLLGVGHGRTLLACVDSLDPVPAPGLRAVALTQPDGNPIASRLAEATGGRATAIPAPPELAQGLDLILAGIGSTDDAAGPAAAGAVGEMLGHFFDGHGRPVESELTRQIPRLPLDLLRSRRIVAIAGGKGKARAVKAILDSGLLSGLIVDEHTARAIGELTRISGRVH